MAFEQEEMFKVRRRVKRSIQRHWSHFLDLLLMECFNVSAYMSLFESNMHHCLDTANISAKRQESVLNSCVKFCSPQSMGCGCLDEGKIPNM